MSTKHICQSVSLSLVLMLALAFPVNSSGREKPWTQLTPNEVFGDPKVRALAVAATKGDTAKLDSLVKAGVDVNSRGRHGLTPLFSAVLAENSVGVEGLLKDGADPNAVTDDGSSIMHDAASLISEPAILALLLKYGGNPNAARVSDGYRPLHLAISMAPEDKSTEKVLVLIAHNADLNGQNESGETPLMISVSLVRYDIALLLLEHGADYTLKNKYGNSIRYYIQQNIKTGWRAGPGSEQYELRKQVLERLEKNGAR